MAFSLEMLKGFLGTISLMALLAVGYGVVVRAFTRLAMVQMTLGALFGSAAVLAMLNSAHLGDGVIIDLRSVPVTLAGAFLGLPGAAVAALMALATRVSIGGVGMLPGSLGIVLSALIGLGWAALVRRPGQEVRNALLLAALSQISLVTSLLLPWDVAWRAVTTVWPVLVPLRFAGVLVVVALLRREEWILNTAKQLDAKASRDPLTGLLNRRGFEVAVMSLGSKRPGAALLVLDLDHFKGVNDTHGHAAGDAVLQTLAVRLRHALRPEDMVARFGGEEMVVFLPDITVRAARDAAARLCEVVRSQPFILPGGASVAVTTSVGGTWTSMIATDRRVGLDALMSHADAMLYVAKDAGRDCWRFEVGGCVTGSPVDAGHGAHQQVA